VVRIEIIAVGRLPPGGPEAALAAAYAKRITWPLAVREVPDGAPERAARLLTPGAHVMALDESGAGLPSRDFAQALRARADAGQAVQLCIGGADGHAPEVLARADALIAFGPQTWPHRLVRVMVLEQIYRAQQILAGHPYHRG
jgi:23S rRNA (pseudouridine1915-N3)-methyltransferase